MLYTKHCNNGIILEYNYMGIPYVSASVSKIFSFVTV